MLFSQRKGFKPVKDIIQVDNMDEDLRNGLWNALTIYYWGQMKGVLISLCDPVIRNFYGSIWIDYFKKPIDTLNDLWQSTYKEIRDYFFGCKWYDVYDFIEFIVKHNAIIYCV